MLLHIKTVCVNIVPAVYNARRLAETPLPDLNRNDNQEQPNQNPVQPDSTTNNNNNQNQIQIQIQTNGSVLDSNRNNGNIQFDRQNDDDDDSDASFNELFVSTSSDSMPNTELDNMNETPHIADAQNMNSASVNHSETKPTLRLLQRIDLVGINAILNYENGDHNAAEVNESGSESGDEIDFVIMNGAFPRPVQYSSDMLIKRENDPISGNLAYDLVCLLACCYLHINTHCI